MSDEERKLMGRRIRDIRTQRGFTIRQLAEMAGLSETHMGNIERGGKVGLETLIVLVRALDVSLDYIVMGVHPQTGGYGLLFRSDDELESMILID